MLTTTCCAGALLVHSAVWLDILNVNRLCAVKERWLVNSAVLQLKPLLPKLSTAQTRL